jgi:hypothetical protein
VKIADVPGYKFTVIWLLLHEAFFSPVQQKPFVPRIKRIEEEYYAKDQQTDE